MGLFGYSKRDYDKRTLIFRKKLTDCIESVYDLGQEEHSKWISFCKTVGSILLKLDSLQYPKKSKQIKAIFLKNKK